QTFTIGKKLVTVTPDIGQAKVYGATDPTLTFTDSPALLGGDSFSGALDRAPGEVVGSYAINIGTLSAGANYTLSLSVTTVDFVITKRDLKVQAHGVNRE